MHKSGFDSVRIDLHAPRWGVEAISIALVDAMAVGRGERRGGHLPLVNGSGMGSGSAPPVSLSRAVDGAILPSLRSPRGIDVSMVSFGGGLELFNSLFLFRK